MLILLSVTPLTPLLDLDNNVMSFTYDGHDLGPAYDDFKRGNGMRPGVSTYLRMPTITYSRFEVSFCVPKISDFDVFFVIDTCNKRVASTSGPSRSATHHPESFALFSSPP